MGVADLSKHRQLLQSLGTGRFVCRIIIKAMTYMTFRHSS